MVIHLNPPTQCLVAERCTAQTLCERATWLFDKAAIDWGIAQYTPNEDGWCPYQRPVNGGPKKAAFLVSHNPLAELLTP